MKYNKALLWVLAMCLVFFSACSADAPSEPTDQPTQTEANTPAETSAATNPTEAATKSEVATEAATEAEVATEVSTETLLLPSDFTTDLYSVTKIDGVCYLNFNDGNQFIPTGDESLDYVFAGVYYDSYEELRDAFLNGKLSTGTMNTIKQQFEKSDQGIAVLDVVNMGKPMAPANATIQNKICWTGTELTYDVDSSLYGSWGFFTLKTSAVYDAFYMQNYENARKNFTVISETDSTFDGVPCKIYEIENNSGQYRDVIMDVTRKNQTFHIYMRYVLDHSMDILPESDTAPYHVYVFSESNGQKHVLKQYSFKETPTLDWLTSFVLAPVSDTPQVAS